MNNYFKCTKIFELLNHPRFSGVELLRMQLVTDDRECQSVRQTFRLFSRGYRGRALRRRLYSVMVAMVGERSVSTIWRDKISIFSFVRVFTALLDTNISADVRRQFLSRIFYGDKKL